MKLGDEAVGDLVALGLARYEARVYLALIGRDSYTAAEAAREAGVPRQRVYDVLDALVRRQLATVRPGKVTNYSAVPPELALARLMSHQRAALERLDRASEGLVSMLQPVWTEGRMNTDPLDYIAILRDPNAIALRFADVQQHAHRELLTFCKPPFIDPSGNADGVKAVRRLSRTGGAAKAIYLNDSLADPGTVEHIERFAEAGEQARFADELPLKLVIADSALVLCDMPDPVAGKESTTTLFIEHPALAGCLRLAFLTTWEAAAERPGADGGARATTQPSQPGRTRPVS
ncbi:TrmB family transcriptional regulator [Streptomyces montanisoli]|uniref:TrmB family transcriptional regulator n=1 Tax=Streptomyces montanisoli TaxID=2798581 RepID=A0A940RZR1_9ACTN|nr:TrmB family transcriptional regulator [Streptomyces montanisoli]MBP0460059.1 TrmB family transcriptional regulator [Streptomyces montanisoli]